MEASQTAQTQQPDAPTYGALVVILLSGQPVALMTQHAFALLAPFGITAAALREALELLVPHLDGGFALPGVVGGTFLSPRSARGFIARTSMPRHAAYLVTAARRLSQGGSLDAERRYLAQHLNAERTRREAAQRVDDAAARHGEVLGWKSVRDDRTTPECRAADGNNFSAIKPPAIGYPGTLHGGSCRCKPVGPHPDGGMLP